MPPLKKPMAVDHLLADLGNEVKSLQGSDRGWQDNSKGVWIPSSAAGTQLTERFSERNNEQEIRGTPPNYIVPLPQPFDANLQSPMF